MLEISFVWKVFKIVIEKIKESLEKKIFEGSFIDGEVFIDFVKWLV